MLGHVVLARLCTCCTLEWTAVARRRLPRRKGSWRPWTRRCGGGESEATASVRCALCWFSLVAHWGFEATDSRLQRCQQALLAGCGHADGGTGRRDCERWTSWGLQAGPQLCIAHGALYALYVCRRQRAGMRCCPRAPTPWPRQPR